MLFYPTKYKCLYTDENNKIDKYLPVLYLNKSAKIVFFCIRLMFWIQSEREICLALFALYKALTLKGKRIQMGFFNPSIP